MNTKINLTVAIALVSSIILISYKTGENKGLEFTYPAYVYILSNKSMPGLVKIGYTSRSVGVRSDELYTTGVPTPFKVEEKFKFSSEQEAQKAEKIFHRKLSAYRVNGNREFFKISPDNAAQIIKSDNRMQFTEVTKDNSGMRKVLEQGVYQSSIRVFEEKLSSSQYWIDHGNPDVEHLKEHREMIKKYQELIERKKAGEIDVYLAYKVVNGRVESPNYGPKNWKEL